MMNIEPLFSDLSKKPRPWIVAGPCSAESREQLMDTARELKSRKVDIFRAGLWKPRTKPDSFDGVGRKGLEWLQEVSQTYDMRVATEVAIPKHVELALRYRIDVLWIGARTVTNPFAMQALADALRGSEIPVLVKNPMNPDLELWIGALERLYKAGIKRLAAVHRGFNIYENSTYRNSPCWNIPIELRRRVPGLPLFCDPSHMGGSAQSIAPLAQEAMELQMDGLMIETHIHPEQALSDKDQQITPEQLQQILSQLKVRQSDSDDLNLHELRLQIDSLDRTILEQLKRRMEVSTAIGAYKQEHELTILQPDRYNTMLQERLEWAEQLGLGADFTKQLIESIHQESVRVQMERLKK